MRHLATCLSFLLRREGWKNVDLVRTTGVHEGNLSRIVAGKADTSPKTLKALALAFPHPSDRDELVRAWVLDQLAEMNLSDSDLARMVQSSAQQPGLLPGVRAHLDILAAASHREDVRDAISGLAGLVLQLPAAGAVSIPLHEVADTPGPANLPAPKSVTYRKRR